ncbi:hypothetical protein NLG97_g3868 [Lecanicillium saksenae]|uniref:Uncharacterized protein n=1 Tax=Lecanicillium saksenae TaxID=468837 RepID=A0ACC1QWZ1_9HYPO|nr:hypothetical protein NLG97_g3868 [Lecanicillium saksenae]
MHENTPHIACPYSFASKMMEGPPPVSEFCSLLLSSVRSAPETNCDPSDAEDHHCLSETDEPQFYAAHPLSSPIGSVRRKTACIVHFSF